MTDIMGFSFGSSTLGGTYSRDEMFADNWMLAAEMTTQKLSMIHLFKLGLLKPDQITKLKKAFKTLSETKIEVLPETWDAQSTIQETLGKILNNQDLLDILYGAEHWNDLLSTTMALYTRESLAIISEASLTSIKTLIDWCRSQNSTYYYGTSHTGQPTEITTLGHFFAAYIPTLIESAEHMLHLAENIQSPHGSHNAWGVVAGPNREYFADLVGMKCSSHSGYGLTNRTQQAVDILSTFHKITAQFNHIKFIIIEMKNRKHITIPREFCSNSEMEPYRQKPEGVENFGRIHSYIQSFLSQALACVNEGQTPGFNNQDSVSKIALVKGFVIMLEAFGKFNTLIPGIQANHEEIQTTLDELPFFYNNNFVQLLVREKKVSFPSAKKTVLEAMKVSQEGGKNRITFESINNALGENGQVSEEEINNWQNPAWLVSQKTETGLAGNLINDLTHAETKLGELSAKNTALKNTISKSLSRIENTLEEM